MPFNFTTIEKKWQKYWLEHKSFAAIDPAQAGNMPKAFVLDMFPYPSGAGLHVGHPEGYTATDIVSRHLRMKGYNVLHPMGWDAFGLPAEQYAIKTGQHPRLTTEQNINNFRRQIQMLGLSYDWDREVDTTDPKYYRWTQWIFLQLFNSYFDPVENKAKPIEHLIRKLENGELVAGDDGSIVVRARVQDSGKISGDSYVPLLEWRKLTPERKRDIIDGARLAYTAEAAVNWCPGLGTVLANEEVVDGRSEVGGFAVERRPMRQWMLRITAYADRLLDDLALLDWPESLKEMQRNWIGKSVGAEVDFAVEPPDAKVLSVNQARNEPAEILLGRIITVFTTRPDTLYGATYLVLAPEHESVNAITVSSHRETIEAYRTQVASRSERDRMAETKQKTGVFTGSFALNPVNGEEIPVYIADYVLMGYGTGAIMAVPAHDERDFEFAKAFDLPIKAVVMPDDAWLAQHRPGDLEGASTQALQEAYRARPGAWKKAFTDVGVVINSPSIDSLSSSEAKEKVISDLEENGTGYRTINYKLHDWLFSRQRYWGEPFPIMLDSDRRPNAIAEAELPLTLPEMEDFRPTGNPEPPLSKATKWLNVEFDGKPYVRETNTMPQWAGSCWYYLRYIDPHNEGRFVDPEKEKYWMPVDLYVGGVEHAVLHLLYARFWHKVLFDLGHVSSPEPFKRLVNQGLILGELEYLVFRTESGNAISLADVRDIEEQATEAGLHTIAFHKTTGEKLLGNRLTEEEVEKTSEGYRLRADRSIRIDARSFKMSKSRKNVVSPDEIVRDFGADTFRLYEMYMGPLEAQKPWNTRDIVGMSRFLNAVWRNLVGDDEAGKPAVIEDSPIPAELDRQMHRVIKKVGEDIPALRFNTAIAELIKLNNEITGRATVARALAETLTLLLAPFAPHVAEEIWQRLGHANSLARHSWPTFDESKLVETTMELPVQVNGKLRGKVNLPVGSSKEAVLQAARNLEALKPWIGGKDIRKEIYVPGKLVNFVV